MKTLKISISLFLYFTITACSNSYQVSSSPDSNHYYAKSYRSYESTRTEFIHHNKDSVKKPAYSDHDLLVSLLNRPMPEDQRMMLAFAARQESYFPDSSLIGIQIKGEKSHSNRTRTISNYAHMIEQDNNSIVIKELSH